MTKRILLCSDHLPPNDGGVEQVVQILAERLDARGYNIGVFALSGNGRPDLVDHESIALFEANTLDITGLVGLQSTISVDAIKKFRHVVAEFNPDIVHIHNRFFYTSYVAGLLFEPFNDAPVVTTMHLCDIGAIDGVTGTIAGIAEQTLGRLLLSRSDHIIAVSGAVGRQAKALGVPDQKVSVVRNAVELGQFEHTPLSGKDIVFIGRLVRNNGPMEFIEAAAVTLNKHPDANFHLVGTGPLRDALENRAEDFNICDSVTFHGFVDDVRDAYKLADVFCRPSYSEGLPLTVLEAMASGVPPVVSNIAGVPEVIQDGETGILLPVGDTEAISDALSEVLADEDRLAEMGRQAREYAENELSWENRTQKVISVYESMTEP